MTPLIILAVGIVLCIFGSNYFSSSEMSYSSASLVRLEREKEGENKSAAEKAIYIIEHFDDALSTILIGNNLVNVAASSMMSVFIIILTNDSDLTWVGTLIITILIIIFGETIAKITAKKQPNIIALNRAPFIRFLMTLCYPIVLLTVVITRLVTWPIKSSGDDDDDAQVEALQSIIETAEDEGVLSKDRTELLQAAINFSEKIAVEVMTSRVDVDAIDIDDSLEEMMDLILNTAYSRIPVYEDSIDNIIGVLHVSHFLKAIADDQEVKIRSLLLKPCFVYKTMSLPEVLNLLKKAKQHLAVVTDEYGGTLGIITMEDVLEEIVGEIWDETDKIEEEFIEHDRNEYEVDGDMNIGDFLELMQMEEFEDKFDSETVGGWIIEIVGHYPLLGQEIEYQGLKIKVLEVSDRRVEKILVKKDR